jgi:hypothetical protein
MTKVRDVEKVIHFVRHTLGCGCPDEVFNDLEMSREDARPGEPPVRKLLVGRRLLICILDCEEFADLAAVLPGLVRKYRRERDRLDYNRVRMVIATSQPMTLLTVADRLFQTLPEVDERMHLHVLQADHLRELL